MAMFSSNQSSSTWILSVKIALISTGVLSMAVALKLSVPVVADFVSSEVPSLWSFALSWLKPPYLYVVINGIIISIVASSKLHHRSSAAAALPEEKLAGGSYGVGLGGYGYGTGEVAEKAAAAAVVYDQAGTAEARVLSEIADIAKEEEKWSGKAVEMEMDDADGSNAWNGLQRRDSMEFSGFSNDSAEKPPVSARFAHRKAIKSSPEGGKSLRVTKPKKQDTLEATWKTITEGRPMPLTRHLKKSDTWDSHVRGRQNDENTPPPPPMKKSETFSESNSVSPSPGSGKVRREPSLSQDELNRRVEAFIKKFNEEMRLQRQESLNQYQEMMIRGAK